MKRIALIVLVAVVFVMLFVVFWRHGGSTGPVFEQGRKQPVVASDGANQSRPATSGQARTASSTVITQSSKYHAIVDQAGSSELRNPSGVVQVSNAGEHAVLKRADGQTLWDAAKEKRPLYAAKPSPDGRLVVLGFEDGKHELYRLQPFEKVKSMPYVAPVERGTAFASWSWIDNERLVGVSAIERSAEDLRGLTAAEREAQSCEKMLLYVYDLESSSLELVQTEGLPLPPVFEVNQIASGGRLLVGADVPGKGWQTLWISVAQK